MEHAKMAETDASPEEVSVAFKGPAILTNKFYVTVGPSVRIAFCEQNGPNHVPQFRNAVSLAHQDAIELADLLKRLLKDIEQQINEAKAQAATAAGVAPNG
jgi:hypothetical protein